MDEVIEIVEVNSALPLKHQLAKVLFATVVAFGATKLAERTYDAALAAVKNHKIELPTS